MSDYVIEELRAESDLVDRLVVTMKLSGGFGGESAVVKGRWERWVSETFPIAPSPPLPASGT